MFYFSEYSFKQYLLKNVIFVIIYFIITCFYFFWRRTYVRIRRFYIPKACFNCSRRLIGSFYKTNYFDHHIKNTPLQKKSYRFGYKIRLPTDIEKCIEYVWVTRMLLYKNNKFKMPLYYYYYYTTIRCSFRVD